MKRLAALLLLIPGLAAGTPAHVVFLVSEDPNNYDATGFSRGFAGKELSDLGHRATIIEGNQAQPTDFPGLAEALPSADLLVVFVRRATPPLEQLDAIRAHLDAGKPLLGIRTANHAFIPPAGQAEPAPGLSAWPGFVPEVLGCQNTGYEGKGMPYRVALHPEAAPDSPLLAGVEAGSIRGHTALYRVLPLAADARPLLLGEAQGIEPAQPLAWTRLHGAKRARIFYTSLGDPEDVVQPSVRRLLANAVQWCLAR